MSKVFVLDSNKQPLNPLHPGRARLLLKQGKAAVYRRYPFTLILKQAVKKPHLEHLRVKIDPGSKTTGIALVDDGSCEVVWAAELVHRGEQIKRDMDKRRAVRKNRRQRKTRYRKPRFDNRRKRKGTLPPSLESRVCNVLTWVRRLIGLPMESGSGGLTKFNRIARALPKTHWCDAACVGRSTPQSLNIQHVIPLRLTATGHGSRQMCLVDEHGFPRAKPKGAKRVKGFQTGDLVRAVVTSGTKQGTYVGKVAVRRRGVFNIQTAQGTVTDIHARFCTLLARSDG
jgi:RRXRR protein